MLEGLFGNITVEKILLYILIYNEGYAKKIADTFNMSLNRVQQQLQRLENGGIIVSQKKGKTRIYYFNPRYPFIKEIKALLEKAFQYLPEEIVEKYYRQKTRPRKKGKH